MTSAPVNASSVYLVTYSHTNLDLVPSQSDFATTVKTSFENSGAGNTLVEWWCWCSEKHQDGFLHFHVAVKLNMQNQWLTLHNYISRHYGIHISQLFTTNK